MKIELAYECTITNFGGTIKRFTAKTEVESCTEANEAAQALQMLTEQVEIAARNATLRKPSTPPTITELPEGPMDTVNPRVLIPRVQREPSPF